MRQINRGKKTKNQEATTICQNDSLDKNAKRVSIFFLVITDVEILVAHGKIIKITKIDKKS